MSTCRSCGAEIRWVTTARGRRMPLSVASSESRFVLTGENDPAGNPYAEVVVTYVSHFADCPNAAQHRKVA